MGGLFERDLELVAQIGATIDVRATAATAAAAAKNLVEDAAEGIGEAARAAAESAAAHARLRVDTGVAILVVSRTFLAVGKDFVGFLGFLEVLFGFWIVRIAVRVMLHGQLAVGLLDVFVGCIPIDAEDVVKVAFCHE